MLIGSTFMVKRPQVSCINSAQTGFGLHGKLTAAVFVSEWPGKRAHQCSSSSKLHVWSKLVLIRRRGKASQTYLWAGRPLTTLIPADINDLQNRKPDLAMSWREVTRWAFTKTMALGYFVEDFYRSASNGQSVGIYLLTYRKQTGDSAPQQPGE